MIHAHLGTRSDHHALVEDGIAQNALLGHERFLHEHAAIHRGTLLNPHLRAEHGMIHIAT